MVRSFKMPVDVVGRQERKHLCFLLAHVFPGYFPGLLLDGIGHFWSFLKLSLSASARE